jgi:ABC-2 type transport system permease protein
MRKALSVARWEFVTTVTRRTYIVAIVMLPLLYGVMFTAAGMAGRSAASTAGRVPTAVVDRARIVDLAFAAEKAAPRQRSSAAATPAPSGGLVSYPDLDAALTALRSRQVAAVFVVEADYLATGSLTAYGHDTSIFAQQGERQRQAQLADAIRASLLKSSMSGTALDRAYAPAERVTRLRVTPEGAVEPITDVLGVGPFAGSLGVFLLLTMAIFISAGFLQQATLADRQNRMIEILLSSVDARDLVVGKILGLGGAGLVQVGVYVAFVIVPGSALVGIFDVPLAKLALSIVYFIIGYLLFACLMAATGMIGRTAQEAAQLSAFWTLSAASPMFFIPSIGAMPNGPLARALSFFPVTGPVTMLMRLAGTDVPTTDVVLSIVIGVVAICGAVWAATKIFRTAAFMYGKRPTLGELVRWLRTA